MNNGRVDDRTNVAQECRTPVYSILKRTGGDPPGETYGKEAVGGALVIAVVEVLEMRQVLKVRDSREIEYIVCSCHYVLIGMDRRSMSTAIIMCRSMVLTWDLGNVHTVNCMCC